MCILRRPGLDYHAKRFREAKEPDFLALYEGDTRRNLKARKREGVQNRYKW